MAEINQYTAEQIAKYREKCQDCQEDLDNLVTIEDDLIDILTEIHSQINRLKKSIQDQKEFLEKLYDMALNE